MNARVFGVPLAIDESIVEASTGEIRRRVATYGRARSRERGEPTEWSGFDVEIDYPEGSTGNVMHEMANIPCGETRAYGEIVTEPDTAPVAVGGACGRNPVPLIVPCHRVVRADSIGGYSGGGDRGVALKRRLLDHERAVVGTDPEGPADRSRTHKGFLLDDRSSQRSTVDS